MKMKDRKLDFLILDLLKDCMTRSDIPLDIKQKIVMLGKLDAEKMNQENNDAEEISFTVIKDN